MPGWYVTRWYVRRPLLVQAMRFSGDNSAEILDWTDGRACRAGDGSLTVRTLEGEMRCAPGDWIVRGVRGEFSPVRNDVFTVTYVAKEP